MKKVVYEFIIDRAVKNCLPKQIVYRDGCNNAQDIESSAVAITLAKPDMLPTRMS